MKRLIYMLIVMHSIQMLNGQVLNLDLAIEDYYELSDHTENRILLYEGNYEGINLKSNEVVVLKSNFEVINYMKEKNLKDLNFSRLIFIGVKDDSLVFEIQRVKITKKTFNKKFQGFTILSRNLYSYYYDINYRSWVLR